MKAVWKEEVLTNRQKICAHRCCKSRTTSGLTLCNMVAKYSGFYDPPQ